MIKLEPGGQAPVISYQVADATSYAGRHYVELALDPEDFIAIVDQQRDEPLGAVSLRAASGGGCLDGIVAGADVLAVGEDCDGALRVDATRPLSEGLAALSATAVQAAAQDGRQIVLVSNLAGELDYRVTASSSRDEAAGGGQDGPVSTGTTTTLRIQVEIQTPIADVELAGPSTGVQVTVQGSAEVVTGLGSLRLVQVRLDEGTWVEAAQLDGVADWSAWTATLTVTESGWHTIDAQALHAAHGSGSASVRVRTRLAVAGDGDATVPTLTITEPLDGTTIVKADGQVVVGIRGTADDPGGVASVTVAVDGGVAAPATPNTAGDWSTWAADVAVTGAGTHVRTAVCRDNAGNQQHQQVKVVVSTAAARTLIGTRLIRSDLPAFRRERQAGLEHFGLPDRRELARLPRR
jgi:hypothetical protein